MNIPNFDANKFYEITGIKINGNQLKEAKENENNE
jgi:hypothetical protein